MVTGERKGKELAAAGLVRQGRRRKTGEFSGLLPGGKKKKGGKVLPPPEGKGKKNLVLPGSFCWDRKGKGERGGVQRES